ncbi:MAG: metallophosphoesterase [Sumerlaeia bacterium]
MPAGPTLILFASDIHIGQTEVDTAHRLREVVSREVALRNGCLAGVFFLGDVGESLRDVAGCLSALGGLAPVQVMIPGNHDLFDTERIGSSKSKYENHLPRVVREAGWTWGENGPVILAEHDLAIVLSPAWASPGHLPEKMRGISRAEIFEARRETLPDGQWITSDWDDDAESTRMLGRFRANLEAIPPAIGRVIAGTHVPPFVEMMGKRDAMDGRSPWFVSHRFGEAIVAANRSRERTWITHVLSGHTHDLVQVSIPWHPNRPALQCRSLGGSVGDPGWVLLEVEDR